MSDLVDTNSNVASHTLAYFRRLDRRMDELTDLVLRQQELIGRLDRDMREGFGIVQRDGSNLRSDLQSVQRDIREMRSDMVLMENRVITAITSDHFASARIDEHEERLTALEQSNPPGA